MGLDIVELIMCIEEEFDIEIPDADAEKFVTVGMIADYVTKKLSTPPGEKSETWRRLQFVISDQINISLEKIRRDSRVVEDLGID